MNNLSNGKQDNSVQNKPKFTLNFDVIGTNWAALNGDQLEVQKLYSQFSRRTSK